MKLLLIELLSLLCLVSCATATESPPLQETQFPNDPIHSIIYVPATIKPPVIVVHP